MTLPTSYFAIYRGGVCERVLGVVGYGPDEARRMVERKYPGARVIRLDDGAEKNAPPGASPSGAE